MPPLLTAIFRLARPIWEQSPAGFVTVSRHREHLPVDAIEGGSWCPTGSLGKGPSVQDQILSAVALRFRVFPFRRGFLKVMYRRIMDSMTLRLPEDSPMEF
jgi:hypothetical protein